MAASSCSSWKTGNLQERKQQQSIHDTIHLLLSLLTECGMPKVPSECFRRAKYNRLEAADDLWKLAFHVMQALIVLDGDMCDGNMSTITYLPITATNLPKVQTILRNYMLDLGYEREEFYLPAVGSQEILLAFAWLLHRSSFFSKLSSHFLTIANTTEIPLRSGSKHIIEHVLEESRLMGCELEGIVAPFKPDNKDTSQRDSYMEALHKLAWFRGKLDTKLKSVQGLCSAYLSMADKIHKSTMNSGTGKGHLSTHEVFLLCYPTQMKSHLSKLKWCVRVLHKVAQWQDREPLFWQWMESILDLQEKSSQDKGESGDGEDKVSEAHADVPLLTAIVQKQLGEFEDLLSRSKHRIDRVEHVWSHKSKILHHKEVNSKLHLIRNQLQFEYPITVKPTNRTALVSSTVELIKSIDCPVYAPVEAIVQKPRHVSTTPIEEPNTQQIQPLDKRLKTILQEVAALDRAIAVKKDEIRDTLEAMEKRLPASVCKVESNTDLQNTPVCL